MQIIKVKNGACEEYEMLLLQWDHYRKGCDDKGKIRKYVYSRSGRIGHDPHSTNQAFCHFGGSQEEQ